MSYQLIDSGNFEKLEQVGPYRIRRPAASATWRPTLSSDQWKIFDAQFERYQEGNGEWKTKPADITKPFQIEINGMQFLIKLTSFGHLGCFPEQEKYWGQIRNILIERKAAKPKVLNLFAYTGGAGLFAAQAGAEVTHVDASKGTVKWASENAKLNSIETIRWIVDDVQAFVEKEIRRGNLYQGIILDPPSYGRGTEKQVWKIENHLTPLLLNLKKLIAPDFLFLQLSCHSQGYTPISLYNQLYDICGEGEYSYEEMTVADNKGRLLPSGCSCLFQAK